MAVVYPKWAVVNFRPRLYLEGEREMALIKYIRTFFRVLAGGGFWLVVWGGVAAFFLAVTYPNIERLSALEDANAGTRARITEEEARVEQIREMGAYSETDMFIEAAARKFLGYVFPDEIVFIKR